MEKEMETLVAVYLTPAEIHAIIDVLGKHEGPPTELTAFTKLCEAVVHHPDWRDSYV